MLFLNPSSLPSFAVLFLGCHDDNACYPSLVYNMIFSLLLESLSLLCLLQGENRGFVSSLFVESLDLLVASSLDGTICEWTWGVRVRGYTSVESAHYG